MMMDSNGFVWVERFVLPNGELEAAYEVCSSAGCAHCDGSFCGCRHSEDNASLDTIWVEA